MWSSSGTGTFNPSNTDLSTDYFFYRVGYNERGSDVLRFRQLAMAAVRLFPAWYRWLSKQMITVKAGGRQDDLFYTNQFQFKWCHQWCHPQRAIGQHQDRAVFSPGGKRFLIPATFFQLLT